MKRASSSFVCAGLSALTLGYGLLSAAPAAAQPVVCRSTASTVKAVHLPGNHAITTAFQTDEPNLQLLLSTPITVTGAGPSCVIADFSAVGRITDNYIVYQVRIDGVPMEGHVSGLFGQATPVQWIQFDDEDEQFVDPFRSFSYNFFQRVQPGRHVVEVWVAAGSGIAPGLEPQIVAPVLTLHYR